MPAPSAPALTTVVFDVGMVLLEWNPRYLYRLVIRKPTPDFRLVAVAEPPRNQQNTNQVALWSAFLHKGGTQGVRVYALRQDDFEGDIRVSGCRQLPFSQAGLKAGLYLYRVQAVEPSTGKVSATGSGKMMVLQ